MIEAYDKTDFRRPDYGVIAWMAIVHIIALAGLWSVSWENFLLMMGLNFMTGCLGITLCFHRLLTHRTFQVPKWVERILTTLGVLALQGGPIEWISHHRMHHAGSDTPSDPHDATRGFFYSHIGWLFAIEPKFDDTAIMNRFARDINADPYYRFLDKTWVQAVLQISFGVVLGLMGGWDWIVWGIFVRLVVVYHSTWLVNSAAHMWGYTNYETNDLTKNNWFVALLTWGEGWHNNHHAHDDVAIAGHKWWEFDVTYKIIKLMNFLGLAKNIKTLSPLAEIPEVVAPLVANSK